MVSVQHAMQGESACADVDTLYQRRKPTKPIEKTARIILQGGWCDLSQTTVR